MRGDGDVRWYDGSRRHATKKEFARNPVLSPEFDEAARVFRAPRAEDVRGLHLPRYDDYNGEFLD